MSQLTDMFLESGLAHEEMADVVDLLLPLEDLVGDAPTPSAELDALFTGAGTTVRPVPLHTARRSAVAGALVLALTGVGATGLSAAANTLPRPIQHQVSQFSQHYLPFDLPEPPAPGPRSQSQPRVASLPTVPDGEDHGEDHGEDSASRSIPTARPGTASHLSPGAAAYPQPAPVAQPSSAPGASPSYSFGSAEPSPSTQPSMSGSPTPTDRPRHGHEGDDPGHDGKGAGHATATPAPGKDGTQDPGKGPGKDGKPAKPAKPGHGGQNPVPAPTEPTLPHPDPQPDPDPPTPTLPLPVPMPDLGSILGNGPANNGPPGLG